MATSAPIWRTKTDPGTAGRKGSPTLFHAGPQKYHRTPQRPARSVGLFLGAWILSLCPVVQQANAQETSEIAKQAQNPIASLISVPFENDFNPQTGINKADSYVLEMKPVVPFTLSNDWNLITRTIIPVIQVPDLAPGVDGTAGVGDVQLSLFLSPAKAGAVLWGAGPAVSFPTASQEILGTRKLSVGPTVVVLRSKGHWLFGTLVQNLFSVAGPSARADVNQMLMQPFANYNLKHGWYLTSSPIITANWEVNPNQRWVVPVHTRHICAAVFLAASVLAPRTGAQALNMDGQSGIFFQPWADVVPSAVRGSLYCRRGASRQSRTLAGDCLRS